MFLSPAQNLKHGHIPMAHRFCRNARAAASPHRPCPALGEVEFKALPCRRYGCTGIATFCLVSSQLRDGVDGCCRAKWRRFGVKMQSPAGGSSVGRMAQKWIGLGGTLVLNVLYQRRFLCVVQPIV
jgi:hypothetical protein